MPSSGKMYPWRFRNAITNKLHSVHAFVLLENLSHAFTRNCSCLIRKYAIHQRLRHQQEQPVVNKEAPRSVAHAIGANLKEANQAARLHTLESFSSQNTKQRPHFNLGDLVKVEELGKRGSG
jgi:hypothetical protein